MPAYQRRSGGGGGPDGWWIATEVEVSLSLEVVRPDVVGWRREQVPVGPKGSPVADRPDWICEVVSPRNANNDTVKKLRLYHRATVPHYWLVDPRDATLTVMRWSEAGYITVLRAERGETVRPEPFDAIELPVGTLFGDGPPESQMQARPPRPPERPVGEARGPSARCSRGGAEKNPGVQETPGPSVG